MDIGLKKNLLIVGGTGFIGSHLAGLAGANNFDVTVLSKNYATRKLPNVKYVNADVSSIGSLRKLDLSSVEYVVNLSGNVNHELFGDPNSKMLEAHFDGVKNLVKVLSPNPLRRFVQIGSSDEYGASTAPQVESLRESPITPYAAGKTAATHLLQMLSRTEGFPALILRPFLVYGPGQKLNRFLPQVIAGCIKGENFPVTRGEQLRDFCFVTDVGRAILSALGADVNNGEIINIASGVPTSIRSMVELVQSMVGGGSPRFGQIQLRIGESDSLYADISKAERLLNWRPSVQLEDGLKRTIKYYSEVLK